MWALQRTDCIFVVVLECSSLFLSLRKMSPENSTLSDRHSYQTEILNNLMDHLLAADVLLGDQAALPTSSSSAVTYTHLANNVYYLAGRIVDKLWQGERVSLCRLGNHKYATNIAMLCLFRYRCAWLYCCFRFFFVSINWASKWFIL